MHDEDRLGWIKLFGFLSIIIAVVSLFFTLQFLVTRLEFSYWAGPALSFMALLSGGAAVVLDFKFDLQDCPQALFGIAISLLYLGLFIGFSIKFGKWA